MISLQDHVDQDPPTSIEAAEDMKSEPSFIQPDDGVTIVPSKMVPTRPPTTHPLLFLTDLIHASIDKREKEEKGDESDLLRGWVHFSCSFFFFFSSSCLIYLPARLRYDNLTRTAFEIRTILFS
jgi:hypothetical protein